jgi:hypothetical protein
MSGTYPLKWPPPRLAGAMYGFNGVTMFIQWMDKKYHTAPDYYREVILLMPVEDGKILGASDHIEALAFLTNGGTGIYISDPQPNDVYVDNWRVSSAPISHRHLEFGTIHNQWLSGVAEGGVANGACEICGLVIPGEIEMMYQFYRLDG